MIRGMTADRQYRVIGVMPASAVIGRPVAASGGLKETAEFFVPLEPLAAQLPDPAFFGVLIGRLKPGASSEQLRARRIRERLEPASADVYPGAFR